MSQEAHPLSAQVRELTGRKAKRLRKQGIVPAIVYGYQVRPTSVQVDAREVEST